MPMVEMELTHKERMLRTLRGEEADVLPAVPGYLCLFLADFERAYYVEQYRRRLRGQVRYGIDHDEDTRFRARALYQSYGILKERPDWVEVHRGATRAWAERTEIVVEERRLYYKDLETGMRAPMETSPMPRGDGLLKCHSAAVADLWDISSDLKGPQSVDERVPILTADELLASGAYDLPARVVNDYGHEWFVSTILDTPFSDAYSLLGFRGLMVSQLERPDLLHYVLRRQLKQTQEVMDAWSAIGADGVYVQEVFTGADLISPGSYDEFVFAYNQPYFEHMSALGLLPVHYVCGDMIPRLDRIAELDIAAVALEESKKDFQIEIDEVVDRVKGRMTVFGNINAVSFGLNCPLEKMAEEVQRQVRAGRRAKGFVVSTGSPFPLDTNPRLVDRLIETAHTISAS